MWKRNILVTTTFIGGYIILSPGSNMKVYSKSADEDDPLPYIQSPKIAEEGFGTSNTGWFSSLQTSTLIHWKLFKLSKARNKSGRHKAIRSLAEMPLSQDWQHRMIAKACDSQTAVGLARIPGIKNSYFLPPPFKDLSQEHLKKDLLELLLSLPDMNSDLCLSKHLKKIKSLGAYISKKHEEWNSEFDDSFNIFHSERKKRTASTFVILCLQALLIYSSIESCRIKMHEKGILKLLMTVTKFHVNNNEYLSLIGQILANFSIEEKYESVLHKTGWIGILASWSQSSKIEVSLPAAKALANLDRDDFHYSYYENGVYLLHPHDRQRKDELYADVIFVHGLRGATFWTWRQHDSKKYKDSASKDPQTKSQSINLSESYTFCWPKDWLASDIPRIRVISVDHSTSVSEWGSLCPQEEEKHSLDAKASQLIEKLLVSNIGEKPIIWVTHSMGGLIVKQILMQAENSQESKTKSIASNTKGIIFFSVPHKGSALAKIFRAAPIIFQPSVDMKQLYKGSPVLLSLHEKFREIVDKYKISVLSYGETEKSKLGFTSSVLVTEDSSDPGFGEFHALDVDHLSSCKPKSRSSKHYLRIVEFINENIQKFYFPKYSKTDCEVIKILSLIP